jgi:hypothetical protein
MKDSQKLYQAAKKGKIVKGNLWIFVFYDVEEAIN